MWDMDILTARPNIHSGDYFLFHYIDKETEMRFFLPLIISGQDGTGRQSPLGPELSFSLSLLYPWLVSMAFKIFN